MKTLLQINSTCNWGSTGRIAEQIAATAEREGWNCYIAHGSRFVNPSSIKTIKIGTIWGNYLHAFLGEFLGRHGFGSTIATYRLIKQMKKLNPDVIHLHNVHGYYINIKVLFEYLSKANIPIVWTLHDCWSFTGHCAHFQLAGCDKWKDQCHNCPLLMAQYKSRIIDRSKKNFLIKKDLYSKLKNVTLVPVSNWLGSFIGDSILQGFDVNIIHNGIDVNKFQPTKSELRKKLGITDKEVMLLGVVSTGFDDEKGRKEFIELSKEKNYKVVLVGLSSGDSKGLPQEIINVGRTQDQKELAQYYSAADIFLNPTYNDSFPTTNMEALACGTPVITYRTGGSPESVNNETGIVVPQGDFETLHRAIVEIIANGKDMYSSKCRERAVQEFNKNDRFMDYVRIYETLIHKK